MAEAVQKFHSAIRWGKSIEELEAFVKANGDAVLEGQDEKNGNRAIHLATQNGHLEITKWLVSDKKVDVNAVNGKGNSGLHMSMGYDFYDQSRFLIEVAKADGTVENGDGNKAIEGIDGDKVKGEAWGGSMCLLKQISDQASMEAAFDALEKCDAGEIDKAVLVQTGMKMKKTVAGWDQARFQAICKR